MKYSIGLLLLFIFVKSNAQLTTKRPSSPYISNEKYFSFNPLGLLEPAMAVGVGFGTRPSKRSEYFSELSYLIKNPLYQEYVKSLNGFRFIAHYRYHFLQRRTPILNRELQKERSRTNPFIGLELRIKQYGFSDSNNFIKTAGNDTLYNYRYKARADCFGGAVIFGSSHNIDAKGNWQLETTMGLGIRKKIARFKNVPKDYQVEKIQKTDWGFVPGIYESSVAPYLPFAIRLRYIIH
jgi:hypothetical protein